MERRETPPKKEEISTTLAKENTAEPSASFDFVRGMKPSGYKHMSHSDSGSKQLETKPRSPGTSSLIGHEDGHHSGDSTANSWKPQKEKDVTIAGCYYFDNVNVGLLLFYSSVALVNESTSTALKSLRLSILLEFTFLL